MHAELEKMLGSDARTRGLQKPMLQAMLEVMLQDIMKHQSPIVEVRGSGVGKTLVISPSASLQDHMV